MFKSTTLSYIFVFIVLSSFSYHNKNEILVIQYDKPINGYKVIIKFLPKVVHFGKNIIGRGTIYFHHLKTNQKFELYNPMMGFPTEVLPITLSKNKRYILGLNKISKELHYIFKDRTLTNNKFGNFGTTEVPFFFYDLNLDGSKELLLPQMNSGQRGIAIFKPFEYSFTKYYRSNNSFLRKKPFSVLDEMTSIDRKNKIIIQHCSGGSKDSYDVIYDIKGTLLNKVFSEEKINH